MSGCVLETVWMSRTCRRRRRNGKVMVLFLGNVDFEVVVSLMMLVLVLKKKKKRDCGSWVSRIEGRNADDDLEGQIKECELHWLGEVGLAVVVKDE